MLFTPLVLVLLASGCIAHPQVITSSGTIIGHTAPNRSDTFEFLGVRYAQAPVGELRFAPPRAFVAPKGTIVNASAFAPDCPALVAPVSTFPNFTATGLRVQSLFTAHTGNPQNEDCLFLNVWTKNGTVDAKKPVLLWIHGGKFVIPGPNSPFYKGQYLSSAQDVVVVTISYRLGIFGFSGAPGLPQNAALRDHRLAVEWVRNNIAGFGGDPSRISIFGQSAGGSSVDYYSYAWVKDPIVAGLISHSGTSLSFLPNNMTYASSLFFNVSGTLGCGNATDPVDDVIACVRAANVTNVLAAAAKVPALPSAQIPQAAFHPTIDDEIIFADYDAKVKAGDFMRVPYMLGNADYESGFYKISAFGLGISLPEDRWDLFNQRAFTCPTGEAADFRFRFGVPTFRFRYFGDWDNLQLYNSSAGLGRGSEAYHGTDLGMVFGTAEDVSGVKNSVDEDATSAYMMDAWAAFARDPAQGLIKFGWPAYNPAHSSLVRLAFNNSPIPDFVDPALYDSVCPVVNDPLPGQGAF